jgi:hypothetical protein
MHERARYLEKVQQDGLDDIRIILNAKAGSRSCSSSTVLVDEEQLLFYFLVDVTLLIVLIYQFS